MADKYIIIGAGLTGATLARKLADAGNSVVVVERCKEVGGHAADYKMDDTYINYYGPHFFHTRDKEVLEFASRFTEWKELSVIFYAQPKLEYYVPWPINKETTIKIHEIMNELIQKEDAEVYVDNAYQLGDTFETRCIDAINFPLYYALIKHYSETQWRMNANRIPIENFKRIRIKENSDPRFFPEDEFVAVPRDGYTNWIKSILDHKDIHVIKGLRVKESDLSEFQDTSARIIMTGPLDELLEEKYGELEYLKVDFHKYEKRDALEICEKWPIDAHAVNFNYKDANFTRATAYHRIYESNYPVVVIEEPGSGEKLYPVRTRKNELIYNRYRDELWERGILCAGRLGSFRYIDMWQAIRDAILLAEELV